ncbi:MAG: hypothetical protein AAFY03_00825 [Pseudomonadota bacterium]
MTQLYVFACNHQIDVSHTELTRQHGEIPDLPPLSAWLSTEVDTDRIELFPAKALAPMSLADYLNTAYDVTSFGEASAITRLNAIEEHVLLVPDVAVENAPNPGADLTLIATLTTAEPDHSRRDLASPEKAQADPPPQAKAGMSEARISGMVALGALVVLGLLTLLFVLMG